MEYNVENEEGILIQGRGNYCSKLKKGKLKTEKLLKISILDEQQTEPKQYKSEVEEICICQNMDSGHHQHLYVKINDGFHARKNPKEQYLKVVTFSEALFSKKCIYVYDHAA